MSEYPEHDKLQATRTLADFTQELGQWLEDSHVTLCELRCLHCNELCTADMPDRCAAKRRLLHSEAEYSVQYVPVRGTTNQQLAGMFGVDLNTLEDEKRSMLDLHRQAMETP